jgi:hydroxypyruvate isomerase
MFSANISMMFQEYSFLKRFGAAKAAGFDAVEFLYPYDHAIEDVKAELEEHRLDVSVFNFPPGDWDAGDRGLAALVSRKTQFRDSVDEAWQWANALKAQRLHIMAGLATPTPKATQVYLENIRYAASTFEGSGVSLLLEPISEQAIPHYFLRRTDQAIELLHEIDLTSVRLQFDIFHHQLTHGNVMNGLQAALPKIAHIQIAGVPERHEPDVGELNYPAILQHLNALGYDGFIGCEYIPKHDTVGGLSWLHNEFRPKMGEKWA